MSAVRLPRQNSVVLVGTLTRDPELRYTPKGQPVCNVRIAMNERYKDASGEWRDAPPTFVPIVVWGPSAERCGERLKKGQHVHIEGRLRSRDWETKDGQKRSTLEVVASRVQFLSRTEAGPGAAGSTGGSAGSEEGAGRAQAPQQEEEVGEEIPF